MRDPLLEGEHLTVLRKPEVLDGENVHAIIL